jgi:hypothetical protein
MDTNQKMSSLHKFLLGGVISVTNEKYRVKSGIHSKTKVQWLLICLVSLYFLHTPIRTHSQYLINSFLTTDGHNEAEFGMSWCAGFGGEFYNSYFEVSTFHFARHLYLAPPAYADKEFTYHYPKF